MKKIVIPVLILTFVFNSCRKNSENELTFWAMGVEGENVSKLIPQFERLYNVKVKVQQIPWTAAHEKLITAFVSETLPDGFSTWKYLDTRICRNQRY
jgi:multiple sugar transport system substrate-binding protein